jgi:chemotaxis protein MotB
MARKAKHEDHVNHEAWAIPYGDLVTLLLAFFVVMYAVSSVNAGKYRVLSDALNSAFRGTPRALDPVQFGERQVGAGATVNIPAVEQPRFAGRPVPSLPQAAMDRTGPGSSGPGGGGNINEGLLAQLGGIADAVELSMSDLVMRDQIVVRNHQDWVEVEIRNDILFASGSAVLSPSAETVIARLGRVLGPARNPVRVEGHTDDVPIRTATFPSNWELSAARAAGVVRLLAANGVSPANLAVLGLGEFRPAGSNRTLDGRNRNRRVLLVILPLMQDAEGTYAAQRGLPSIDQIRLPGAQVTGPVNAAPSTQPRPAGTSGASPNATARN